MMKLTTRFRYGTRAMLALAQHAEEKPVSLKLIAEKEEISLKYLENLFTPLQRAGLVRAFRGPQGGYVLLRKPQQITLRDLYAILESSSPFVDCSDDSSACDRYDNCITREVWTEMYRLCMNYLDNITLETLLKRTTNRQSGAE